ncbi:hypothetical protein [Knoellia aerolata]|uniref:NYN domain-containing protein n=1 Tax=Knoellia aerolata DSM 18566 TaxID=1385519 RepID=A0A0A0JW90_9MICO|nr:hypothetical protein [Knoellia aerolata]KGN41680.1 hypothetical protein N801_06425 [Knoellia aerolata DSM 18566]
MTDVAPAPRASPRQAADHALLWDLDNVTLGREGNERLARTILQICAATDHLYAACHRRTWLQHRGLLGPFGITVLSGGTRRQGADHLLLERANGLAAAGVSRFFLASNDGDFARLPAACTITVLTLAPDSVARRLFGRATSVITLPKTGI